jgi:uncharacterized protein YjdB
LAAVLLGGCGDDDVVVVGNTPTATATKSGIPSATPTRTAAPTVTHTPVVSAAVAGVVVVDARVGNGSGDGLTELPPGSLPSVATGFDRGLGNATWVADAGEIAGETDGDGRFSVTGLSPGRHILRFTKTIDGNLMEFVVPIVVGDDGAAEVVAEVSWGLVRATSTYTQGGGALRTVFAPNGSFLTTRDGQAVELSDGWRTLVDGDGDGHFDSQGCSNQLYACDASGCGTPEDICVCIPSCPGCEDCGQRACVPRSYFHTPECGPDGLCKPFPYQCRDGGGCADANQQCSCVASCPDCDDCVMSACVDPCTGGEPIDLTAITVYGNDRLVAGQRGDARASALMSDGSAFDVTWLVGWESSAPGVATVDSWGRVAAVAAGAAAIRANLLAVDSAPLALTVVDRPTLQQIHLENVSCQYYPHHVDPTGAPRPLPPQDAALPPPFCTQVIRIGGDLQFRALGQFDTGYYEDVTDEVEWAVDPSAVGTVAGGRFTAVAAGAASVTASLGSVTSNAQTVTVVEQASITALSIYPGSYPYQYIDGGPVADDLLPCFECGYFLTLLAGDTIGFSATAHYDTGEWEDVTARVAWRSADAAVMSIDGAGSATAAGAGEVGIDATLGEVTSAAVTVRVVAEATLQGLSIYMDGADRAIGKGDQAIFHAVGFYDVGFSRDVTDTVTWRSSDDAVGSFDLAGAFTGRGAGNVTVWAELDGVQSASLPLEVYATSELDFCDAEAVNRGSWDDDFNRVTLESDCATYTPPDLVALRFTVTETQRPIGIFDPCLDLYAYQGDRLVRTIREEGCGDPFLAPGAPERDEAVLRYQLTAFWDLKDEAGTTVAPGEYEIRGRFYLYYDPIVSIRVTVTDPSGGS